MIIDPLYTHNMVVSFSEVDGCLALLPLPINQPAKQASLPVDGGVGGGADVKGVVLVVLQFMFIYWVLLAGYKDLPGLKHTSHQNEVKDNGVTQGGGDEGIKAEEGEELEVENFILQGL